MQMATVLRLRNSFGFENVHLEEQEIGSPGPFEVRVRFRAASLNYRDLMVVLGQYNPKLEMPRILGSDAAGEVIAVGEKVTTLKLGDRVASLFFQAWQAGEFTKLLGKSALGAPIDGVFATERVLPETGLIKFPAHLSYEEAATLPCAAVTAWNALVEKGKLRAGQTVVLLGTGGVSIFALQIAKAHGARAILTSSSDEKLERAKALGADETINYKRHPDWDTQVLDLTGGTGADHIVEVGGAGTLPKSLNAVRAGGQVHLIGVLSDPDQGVNVKPMVGKSITMNGIYVGSRAMFAQLNSAIEANTIKPVIDQRFPLSQGVEALRYMQSGSHFGKVVLTLGD